MRNVSDDPETVESKEYFIPFTVKVLDQDTITVTNEDTGGGIVYGRNDGFVYGPYDTHANMAAKWFAAHPPKPADPLEDAKVGEYWEVTRGSGAAHVIKIMSVALLDRGDITSARKVYVIPADEASAIYNSYGNNTYRDLVGRVLDLAL